MLSFKRQLTVVAVKWSNGPKILPDPPSMSSRVAGEATVVDLGAGKYLFALIKDAERLGLKTFGKETFSIETGALGKSIVTTKNSVGQSLSIPAEHMPLLVTFTDINDPTSVIEVNPNDLVASFGPDYSLRTITLEITDEVMTEGKVEKALKWIVNHKLRLKSPSLRLGAGSHAVSDILPEEELRKSDFIRNRK